MAWRDLRQRSLSSVLTSLSVALGVALLATVLLLERESQRAFSNTAAGVEILVGGNKGSRVDTLLATLYHVGRAPGRVAWSYYERLAADPRVRYAIPLAVGDTYRGQPVVGTTIDFFRRFEPRPGASFDVRRDALAPGQRRAVAGALAARDAGLAVGDRFFPAHGGWADDRRHAQERFTVVAIARATGTAHDRAIWIDIRDFLDLRGHHGLAREGADAEEEAVSAVLLKTTSDSPLVVEPLVKEINDGNEAQAIRPMQVVSELFVLVGDVRLLLQWTASLVVVVAALSVMLALSSAMTERRRDIAILRALGASRARVSTTILVEAALLCAGGAILGLLLGHGGAALVAPWVEARAGVRLDGFAFAADEAVLVAALVLVGIAAGTIPALRAYRTDVARGLDPTS